MPSPNGDPPDIDTIAAQFPHLQEFGHLPLDVLNLTRRVRNALWIAKINTRGELRQLREVDLFHIRNMGTQGFQEILQNLHTMHRAHLDQHAELLRKHGAQPSRVPTVAVGFYAKTPSILCARGIGTLEARCRPTSQELSARGFADVELSNIIAVVTACGLRLGTPANEPTTPQQHGDPYQEMSDDYSISDIIDQLPYHLHERDWLVLKLRYGLDGNDPQTLEQIGQRLGLTRERIRQIEVIAHN